MRTTVIAPLRRRPLRIADKLHLVAPECTVGPALRSGSPEGKRARELALVVTLGGDWVSTSCGRTIAHGALEVSELGHKGWQAGADEGEAGFGVARTGDAVSWEFQQRQAGEFSGRTLTTRFAQRGWSRLEKHRPS